MEYQAAKERYDEMSYFKCGKSGLKLPGVSLGLWHNFGLNASTENMKDMIAARVNAINRNIDFCSA